MLSTNQIQQFYKENVPTCPDIKFRQIKIIVNDKANLDGTAFKKARRKFCTEKKLQKWLIKQAPTDVYQSGSLWLNPQELSGKKNTEAGYKAASRLLLGSDYVIDIDTFDLKKALKVQIALKKLGYEKIKFKRTGRGIHITVQDWYEKTCKPVPNPYNRIHHVRKMKEKTTNTLIKEGIFFDKNHFNVSTNPLHIFRTVGSLHHNGTKIEEYDDFPTLYQKIQESLPAGEQDKL